MVYMYQNNTKHRTLSSLLKLPVNNFQTIDMYSYIYMNKIQNIPVCGEFLFPKDIFLEQINLKPRKD